MSNEGRRNRPGSLFRARGPTITDKGIRSSAINKKSGSSLFAIDHPRNTVSIDQHSASCPPLADSVEELALVYCIGIHKDEFPNIAIQVLESMSIHEAMVLGLIVSRPTGGDGLPHQFIDLAPAFR